MQDIWCKPLDWDDQLTDELQEQWIQYHRDLQIIEQIQIPRWFHTMPKGDIQMHRFSDASSRAYGAVVYRIRKSSRCNRTGVGDIGVIKNTSCTAFGIVCCRIAWAINKQCYVGLGA